MGKNKKKDIGGIYAFSRVKRVYTPEGRND
jgi:hypothetical protein